MKEDYLLSGNLEKTNEPYAVAKIAGLKMCESYNYQYKTNFKCLMPTNTYGPNDNYSLNNSHFLPALLRKVILAKRFKKKSITLWGTGTCKREAIHVDDVASAVLFFLKKKVPQTFLNIGSGEEMKISDYANLVKNIIYPNLHIKFNKDKSLDGVKRKLLDSNIAKSFGWKSKIKISKGIESTYKIIKNKKFNAES